MGHSCRAPRATSLNAAIDALTSRQKKSDKARKSLLKQAARRILDFGKDNIFTSLSDIVRPPPTNEDSPEALAIDNQSVQRLTVAISGLPRNHLFVIRRYFFEDESLSAIARELGFHESRAHQLRSEAIDMLQGALTRGPDAPDSYHLSDAFRQLRSQRNKRYAEQRLQRATSRPTLGPS